MAQILILDDEIPLLQSLTLELGRGGHRCLPAETGAEGLAPFQHFAIACHRRGKARPLRRGGCAGHTVGKGDRTLQQDGVLRCAWPPADL